jgi:hypothetical protein
VGFFFRSAVFIVSFQLPAGFDRSGSGPVRLSWFVIGSSFQRRVPGFDAAGAYGRWYTRTTLYHPTSHAAHRRPFGAVLRTRRVPDDCRNQPATVILDAS